MKSGILHVRNQICHTEFGKKCEVSSRDALQTEGNIKIEFHNVYTDTKLPALPFFAKGKLLNFCTHFVV